MISANAKSLGEITARQAPELAARRGDLRARPLVALWTERVGRAGPWIAGAAASGLLAGAIWYSKPVGTAIGVALVLALTWWLASLRRRVDEVENRDPISGAASHMGLLNAARRETRRCRAAGTPLSVAILDCDRLKQLNDTLGHCVGDEALQSTTDLLLRMAGSRGTVARLWGDSFGIVLPALSFEAVRDLLERIQSELKARMAERGWPMTLSIGAVTFDVAPDDPGTLIPAADELMYAVKNNGKDGIVCRRMAGRTVVEQTATNRLPPCAERVSEPAEFPAALVSSGS